MDATTTTASVEPADLPDLLPWETICERHPLEWVVLIDMVERDYQIAAARVFAHSADPRALREAANEAIHLRGEVGKFWTGYVRSHWKFIVHACRDV